MFPHFEKHPELTYGFSNRRDGSMHRHLEKENRNKYFESIGIDPGRVVTPDLVHGTGVAVVSVTDAGRMIPAVDGLVTQEKDVFLTATAADCFIVYFYDPIGQVIGIVHVGWRGVLLGISGKIMEIMAETFGTLPANLLVGIGPGIQKCHFEISAEDRPKYQTYSDFILEKEGRFFVDLPGVIKKQFRAWGVLESNVEDSGVCTFCEEDLYFSYRRDKPKEVQPMVGYIGLV